MLKINIKQVIVLILGTCAIVTIILLGPRYKITEIGSGNYIKTEQSSSLYKRSIGKVKLHWGPILFYESATILFCGFLIFLLEEKDKPIQNQHNTTTQ